MIFLPELAEHVALVTRREPTVVTFAARVLRKGGVFPETKRGRGATPMTAREAAQLVLAVGGMKEAQDSVRVVREYWAVRLDELRPMSGGRVAAEDKRPGRWPLVRERPLLEPLQKRETRFGEALEFLIANATELADCDISFEMRRPARRGRITIWGPGKEGLFEGFYRSRFASAPLEGAEAETDHYDIMVLGERALLSLHRALNAGSRPEAEPAG